jgi:hypothetical protein
MKRPGVRTGRSALAASLMAIAVGTVLSACGGTTTQTIAGGHRAASPCETAASSEHPFCRKQDKQREYEAGSEPTEAVSQTVGGPVSFVGEITGPDGRGTTLADRFSLGPLVYGSEGTPPEVVLNACQINDPGTIAASVFARGQVTASYQEGTLPLSMPLNSWEELAQGGAYFLTTAFRLDGQWRCNSETGLGDFTELQPGESLTVPIWVVGSRVLTNAQPELPASVTDGWYFKFVASVNGYSSLSISGPGAAACEEELGEDRRLMLWNRSGTC